MSELIRRSWDISVRAMDQARRAVDVVASTDAVDSYGEVLVQDWDLARYLKNPVVLFGHNSFCLPIGHAEGVRVEQNQLLATLVFVDERANPLAEQVWQGFLQGSLRAVSVGFRSKQGLTQEIDGRVVYVLSGNELVEISVVPLPANPEAVAVAAKSMDIIRALVGAQPPKEATNMSTLISVKTVLALLALPEAASEAEVVDKVKSLERAVADATSIAAKADDRMKAAEASVAQLLAAVGAETLEKALGAVEAGKTAIAQLADNTKKLDELERAKLIADAKAEKKLSPDQEVKLAGKSLEFVKGFLELQHPIPALAASDVKQPTAAEATLPPELAGKKWEDLQPMQKHKLLKSHPMAYEALKADFDQRQAAR